MDDLRYTSMGLAHSAADRMSTDTGQTWKATFRPERGKEGKPFTIIREMADYKCRCCSPQPLITDLGASQLEELHVDTMSDLINLFWELRQNFADEPGRSRNAIIDDIQYKLDKLR
jgi:hypothetical protein